MSLAVLWTEKLAFLQRRVKKDKREKKRERKKKVARIKDTINVGSVVKYTAGREKMRATTSSSHSKSH